MSDYSFRNSISLMLEPEERSHAAELLSYAYTKWQNDPRNVDPLVTDTSVPVYERLLQAPDREALLYYEGEILTAVFVHALSPSPGQSPLRKLSFIGVRPREKGFGPLKAIFRRYAEHVADNGEDVVCTTDLVQTTLNALLEEAGFQEIKDRNGTYFILSRLLNRKLISWQTVHDDFIIDEIITLDGKALRREKKLFQLQTTTCDPYAVYRSELAKRIRRSIPESNRKILAGSFSHAREGILFLLGYYDSIILRSPDNGLADTGSRIFGPWSERNMEGLVDCDQGIIYLLPESVERIREIAGDAQFRPGVFDFMTFCLKMLATVVVATGAPLPEVETVLGRPLHPQAPLRLMDMVEAVLALDMEAMPLEKRNGRTPFNLTSSYACVRKDGTFVDKRKMAEQALSLHDGSRAPIVCCCGHEEEFDSAVYLFEEAEKRRIPVLIVDFGSRLSRRMFDECMVKGPSAYPYCSIIHAQDYYQLPVLLELLGLQENPDWI